MTASTTTASAGNGSFNLACCPPAERMKIEARLKREIEELYHGRNLID